MKSSKLSLLSGLLVFLFISISVNGISPSTGSLAASIKGELIEKTANSKKKNAPIGTSSVKVNDDSQTSISSFSSSTKTARIASELQKAQVEKSLLKSLAQRGSLNRDNVGHNRSTKIKVVGRKITAKTISKAIDTSEVDDSNILDDEVVNHKNPAGAQIKQQILMAVIYMAATHFTMKINFNDQNMVQLGRVIFAFYLLGSQLLFYIIKKKIETDDDNTEIDIPSANLSMKGLKEKIPILNELGKVKCDETLNIIPAVSFVLLLMSLIFYQYYRHCSSSSCQRF